MAEQQQSCLISQDDSVILQNPPPAPVPSGGGTDAGCVSISTSKAAGQYVRGGDKLQVTVWSSLAGLTVTLAGQQVTPDCKVLPFLITLNPPETVTPTTFTLTLAEGMVSSLAAKVTGAVVQRGQTYVRASVGLIDGGSFAPYATLISDYVTSSYQPGFPPAGPFYEATEGPGYIRVIDTALQNAQTDWYVLMPSTRVWRVIAATWILDTSADVGNRLEQLEGANQLGTTWIATADATVPASQSGTFRFVQNANPVGNYTTTIHGRLPMDARIKGPNGGSVGTNQNGMSSGADVSTFFDMTVEEWLNI